MRTRLKTLREQLASTYWIIPAIMVTLSIMLSLVTIHIDQTAPPSYLQELGWLGVDDPDGARSFLSVVAGSMIGTTGVIFSITIASLVQASNQLGPRLLNNFLRDRGNQLVLGTLTATYTYCLFTLKSINNTATGFFVPNLSIITSIMLTLLSLGALVYFFHHITASLQADNVIRQVGEELTIAIEKIFPEKMSLFPVDQEKPEEAPTPPEDNLVIYSERSGYLQAIDRDTLIGVARENDLMMRTELRPGEFTATEAPLVTVWPKREGLEELEEKIEKAFILGDQWLRIQNVEYHLDQLIEIAVRALSSGINDPFTAMNCIDQIAASLTQLLERSIPTGYYYDEDDDLRLITKPLTYTEIIETSFNQIRRIGSESVSVSVKLLEAIEKLAPQTKTWEQSNVLREQADRVYKAGKENIPEWDFVYIEEKYVAVLRALDV